MCRLILQTQYPRFPVSHAPVSKLSIPWVDPSILFFYYRSLIFKEHVFEYQNHPVWIPWILYIGMFHESMELVFLLLNCYICIICFIYCRKLFCSSHQFGIMLLLEDVNEWNFLSSSPFVASLSFSFQPFFFFLFFFMGELSSDRMIE